MTHSGPWERSGERRGGITMANIRRAVVQLLGRKERRHEAMGARVSLLTCSKRELVAKSCSPRLDFWDHIGDRV